MTAEREMISSPTIEALFTVLSLILNFGRHQRERKGGADMRLQGTKIRRKGASWYFALVTDFLVSTLGSFLFSFSFPFSFLFPFVVLATPVSGSLSSFVIFVVPLFCGNKGGPFVASLSLISSFSSFSSFPSFPSISSFVFSRLFRVGLLGSSMRVSRLLPFVVRHHVCKPLRR